MIKVAEIKFREEEDMKVQRKVASRKCLHDKPREGQGPGGTRKYGVSRTVGLRLQNCRRQVKESVGNRTRPLTSFQGQDSSS